MQMWINTGPVNFEIQQNMSNMTKEKRITQDYERYIAWEEIKENIPGWRGYFIGLHKEQIPYSI